MLGNNFVLEGFCDVWNFSFLLCWNNKKPLRVIFEQTLLDDRLFGRDWKGVVLERRSDEIRYAIEIRHYSDQSLKIWRYLGRRKTTVYSGFLKLWKFCYAFLLVSTWDSQVWEPKTRALNFSWKLQILQTFTVSHTKNLDSSS